MADNTVDNWVDKAIQQSIKEKKHFFMFAGAGSGKTRSLKNVLEYIAETHGRELSIQSKSVAVITYTNAACDEISRRVGYNPLFTVSTIHSFLWELIKPFQKDIKKWVITYLSTKVLEFEDKATKARSKDYRPDIEKAKSRLERAKTISKFAYNPNGENIGRNSLDHAQVISMGTDFISGNTTMQKVLVCKYPILLIDESQDTKKELVDALLKIESLYAGVLVIGMFGDMMQRIYADGKDSLETVVPETWERPKKKMNHRSNKRIIQLANSIRESIDGREQQARSDKTEGFVRLFVVLNNVEKDVIEKSIYNKMAEICKDNKWTDPGERKALVLEHSMAASRLGFEGLYNALAKTFSQSFRDGDLAELKFLMTTVEPVINAIKSNNEFTLMKLLREKSHLLKADNYRGQSEHKKVLCRIRTMVEDMVKLWRDESIPTCIEIYRKLAPLKLFELPERMEKVLEAKNADDDDNERIDALRQGLEAPYTELLAYWNYVTDNTQFSTHQGIKGLEFDRVSVIMDDANAGGFLFSYDKLFGAKSLTDTDKRNAAEGKDNSITRTLRLFYVTCTRAKESLALIAYTNNTEAVRQTALKNGWFYANEIEVIS